MADYDDIALLKAETAVMAALSGMVGSALQINPTADSNIPTNSKRLVDAGGGLWRFENWNGSSWVVVTFDATTLQGSVPTDFDYSAGDGIDIASNIISIEQATVANLGGVQLALENDVVSTDKSMTPAGVQQAIDDRNLVEAMVSNSLLADVGKAYLLPDVNVDVDIKLPASPVDGDKVVFYSNDASQGEVHFLADGASGVRISDDDPDLLINVTGTVTSTSANSLIDSGVAWTIDEYKNFRARNTTKGFVSHIEDNTATHADTPVMLGGTGTGWDIGDGYEIVAAAATVDREADFQQVEFIYRASFDYWTYSLTGNSAKALVANPDNSGTFPKFQLNGQIEPRSLQDHIEQLDAVLEDRFGNTGGRWVNNIAVTEAQWAGQGRDDFFEWTGTANAIFDILIADADWDNYQYCSMVINNSPNGSYFDLIVGAGVTTLTLINGSRTSDGDKIRVPAGAYVYMHYIADDVMLVFTPFSTVIKVP